MAEASGSLQDENIKCQIVKMQRDGHIKKAIEYCQSALRADPTNADLHVSLGDLYIEWHQDIYQSKQYIDEAVIEYQRALESNLDSASIHLKLGRAFFIKGELDKAINHSNLAIKYDEKMSNAYLLLAKCFARKERFLEGLSYAQNAVMLGGISSARAHFVVHSILKSVYDKTFKTKLNSLWNLFLGFAKLPFDREGLRELFTKINYLRFFPIIFQGYYLEKSKNIYKAIDLYSKAIEQAPGFYPLYLQLGDVYRSIGRFEEAVNEYRMVLWYDPANISAYKALSQVYEEQGDYDSAIEIYEKLIKINPNDALLHSNLANILYLKGEVKEAISSYHRAIMLNPNKDWTSVIAQTLGYVFQETSENHDAAISAYQSAALLNPSDIDLYVSLGSAFYDKNDYENALSIYRYALEIDPDNSRIHCNLGYLLWGKGDINESIKEYELAIKQDSEYDIAYNNLGVIYLDDLCIIQKAAELFEEAIRCNPNYALAYYNLARAMSTKGDKVEAARLYQVALDINTITNELDSDEIKDRINNLFD